MHGERFDGIRFFSFNPLPKARAFSILAYGSGLNEQQRRPDRTCHQHQLSPLENAPTVRPQPLNRAARDA